MITEAVSVVIPCYTEARWPRLTGAIESALRQVPAPAEVVVVVDYNDALADRLRHAYPQATVLANKLAQGVSGARNTGVFHTRTSVVVLLDDDAQAQPGWLAAMTRPLADPQVVGVGGAISPRWETGRPAWFPDEMLWAVSATDPALSEVTPVRNVWAASLAVRRDVFDAVGGFRVDFGKIGHRYRPEDTDLCVRMARESGGHWVLTPEAVVSHPVSAQRSRFRWLLGRCYEEGRGKVAYARLNGPESLGREQDYLRRELPRAVGRGLVAPLRGQGVAPAARALTIVAAVGSAGVGAVLESVRRDLTTTYTRRQSREPRRVS